MAIMDLEYIEIDGLLYPNLEVENKELLNNLGKYGEMHLHYLHQHKPKMYQQLLFSGRLAEHCASIDKAAFEQAEQIRTEYLKTHPMPNEDTLERIQVSTQAQLIADETVLSESIL